MITRPNWTVALAALCALLALTLAAPAPAPAAARAKRHRCHLAGTNLAGSKLIKVVRTKNVLRGCSLPYGRIVTLEVAPDLGLGGASISLDRVAGRWVITSGEGSNQYTYFKTTTVANLRTGRGYVIYSDDEPLGSSDPFRKLDAALLDSRGRSVIAERTIPQAAHAPQTEEIIAFAPDATAIVLDSGDAATVMGATLTFAGGVIGWQHGAEPRTVRFR